PRLGLRESQGRCRARRADGKRVETRVPATRGRTRRLRRSRLRAFFAAADGRAGCWREHRARHRLLHPTSAMAFEPADAEGARHPIIAYEGNHSFHSSMKKMTTPVIAAKIITNFINQFCSRLFTVRSSRSPSVACPGNAPRIGGSARKAATAPKHGRNGDTWAGNTSFLPSSCTNIEPRNIP